MVLVIAGAGGASAWWATRQDPPEWFVCTLPPVPVADVDREVAYYVKRTERTRSGLDQAALAQAYLAKAQRAGEDEWFAHAEQSALESLRSLPVSNSAARVVLAEVAVAHHDFSRAIALATDALREDARCGGALALLVVCHLATGELERADDAARTLIKYFPSQRSWTLAAQVAAAHGQDDRALEHFTRAVRVDELGAPEQSAKTRATLARHLLHRGHLDLARRVCREALRLVPAHPNGLEVMAEIEARDGRLDEAERLALLAFRTWGHPELLLPTAEALARAGEVERATALWAEAERGLRAEVLAGCAHHGLLARLLLARGRGADLREALQLTTFEVSRRRDAKTLAVHVWALERTGRLEDARSVVVGALAQGTQDPELFVRAGIVEESFGSPELAATFYRRALAVDPGQPDALLALERERRTSM